MNYEPISLQVLQTIKEYGQSIKVINIAGVSISTYGVWGKIEQEEYDEEGIGNITVNTQDIYIPYIKTSPEVGGTIVANKITYRIKKVTPYQPTTKAVGFKIQVLV